MKKSVKFEIIYESDMIDFKQFNSLCDFKTMSIFNGIPMKGVFNQSQSKIDYIIKKITVK